MVGCRAADNGFGLAKSSVHVLEALQKAGQGTGADGDEAAEPGRRAVAVRPVRHKHVPL